MEWIKIDKFGSMPEEKPFLVAYLDGMVFSSESAFDYYDADYWIPIPKFPYAHVTITNDQWVKNLNSIEH